VKGIIMKFTTSRWAKRRIVAIAVGSALVGAALAGCSGNAGAASGSTTDVDAALKAGGTITYWTWTPQAKDQVAAFEKAYPKVKVKLVNAGTGNDEYTKLQNVIKAGSGGPDVAQVEYFAMPQFALGKSLLDLKPYGFDKLSSNYTASTWAHVDINGAIYGLPQDSGPMALFYNKKVFDQFGLTVPTTWDEYIADAKKLHAADPSKYIAADTGDAGFTTSMIWQAGGTPFVASGSKVTVNLQDAGSKKWANSWNQLVEGKLLSTIPGWSDDWYKALGDGTIATLVTGAWMPGVLEGSVPQASGNWRVAPMPSYDGAAATAENGGGGQVVLKQSKNPALAAGFLRWLNSDKDSVKIFLASGGFPSTTADLNSDAFKSVAPSYFGGQKINEVLSAAAGDVVKGWTYLPYQVYANSIYGDTVGQSYSSFSDVNTGLEAWQKQLVSYGNEQGFTVTG
jgi:multiple sugar transport system substrate-binding protein